MDETYKKLEEAAKGVSGQREKDFSFDPENDNANTSKRTTSEQSVDLPRLVDVMI